MNLNSSHINTNTHTHERTFKFRPKPHPGCLHSPQTARTSRPAIKSLSKVAFPSTDVNGGDSPRLYVRWMFLVQPPSFFNRIPGGNWNGSGQKGNLRPLGQRRPVQTAINQSINSAIMVRNKLILQFFTAGTPEPAEFIGPPRSATIFGASRKRSVGRGC